MAQNVFPAPGHREPIRIFQPPIGSAPQSNLSLEQIPPRHYAILQGKVWSAVTSAAVFCFWDNFPNTQTRIPQASDGEYRRTPVN